LGIDDLDPVAAARDYLAFQQELGATTVPRPAADADQANGDSTPSEAVSTPEQEETLDALAARVSGCQACGLCEHRNTVVFGSGNPTADVVFVGEAPGWEEDVKGLPFVGAAGDLLTKMISGIHLSREDVYIANVIKCRPPGNRDPEAGEIEQCEPYLRAQLAMIQPKVICTLGRFAAQTLLQSTTSMGRLRGKVYEYEGIKLIPTYHPAALLRNPQWKRPTWQDLKLVRFEYDGLEL